MGQDGRGQLTYLEGQGKAVEGSARQHHSCPQLPQQMLAAGSLGVQRNHLGSLSLFLETPEIGKHCTPNAHGQVNEGYSPYPGEKHPQAQTPYSKYPW